jgi:hypothetical protein
MTTSLNRFSLEEAAVSLDHKNERIEKHGDEDRLACDLNFHLETNNAALTMFSPTLRGLLYERDDGTQGALLDDADHLTKLRNPPLHGKPLPWGAGELVGAELRFHFGIKPDTDVVFSEAKIHKFKLDCREGGTVVIGFQAQVYPTDEQSGKMSKFLLDKVCTISVTPPHEGG